jgi:hypothetical protein
MICAVLWLPSEKTAPTLTESLWSTLGYFYIRAFRGRAVGRLRRHHRGVDILLFSVNEDAYLYMLTSFGLFARFNTCRSCRRSTRGKRRTTRGSPSREISEVP